MVPELVLWQWVVVFAIGAAALVRSGVTLAGAGDEIAERTGLGGLVVGILLVSFATSMPELVTDISAAAAGAPDLALGDLFGSSMANMAILAVVDLVHRGRVWPRIGVDHARVAAVAIALTAMAVLAIATPRAPAIGWIGLDSLVIVGAYVASVAWFRRASGGPGTPTGWAEAPDRGVGPLRRAGLAFAAAAAVILLAAPATAVAAQEIAEAAGIAETTMGTGLLALATSMPELVASLAALRIGAHDLAVGNLFGSNAANMGLIVFADAAYRPGPILAAVDPAQVVAATGAIVLMALALAAIVGGTETRLWRLEPDATLLLVVYVALLGAVAVS
ncbi:MAG: sodium:calcium antiporter [Acidimicrobiales bacterium]|nr:sodium:calcium antiporter [Acidimicrobiales bacterium]